MPRGVLLKFIIIYIICHNLHNFDRNLHILLSSYEQTNHLKNC